MSEPIDIPVFNLNVIEEFRAADGAMSGERTWEWPLVLLTTTGAKSGASTQCRSAT